MSLVLSGANPGALIENVTIRHSDGEDVMLEDEVIIYTGFEIEHAEWMMTTMPMMMAKMMRTVQDIYDSMS